MKIYTKKIGRCGQCPNYRNFEHEQWCDLTAKDITRSATPPEWCPLEDVKEDEEA